MKVHSHFPNIIVSDFLNGKPDHVNYWDAIKELLSVSQVNYTHITDRVLPGEFNIMRNNLVVGIIDCNKQYIVYK